MSEKKENREEGKEQSSSRSGLNDEQIEAALNACTFGYLREKCKNCPLDSDKEPCITNLHLAALAYIRRLNHRAKVSEREAIILSKWLADKTRKNYPYQAWLEAAQKQAEKELAEERKDD